MRRAPGRGRRRHGPRAVSEGAATKKDATLLRRRDRHRPRRSEGGHHPARNAPARADARRVGRHGRRPACAHQASSLTGVPLRTLREPACLRSPASAVRDRRDRRKLLRSGSRADADGAPAARRSSSASSSVKAMSVPGSPRAAQGPLQGIIRGRVVPAPCHRLRWLARLRRPGRPRLWSLPGRSFRGCVHQGGLPYRRHRGLPGLDQGPAGEVQGLPGRAFRLHLKDTEWRHPSYMVSLLETVEGVVETIFTALRERDSLPSGLPCQGGEYGTPVSG